MMNFRIVKKSIVDNVLAPSEAGRYVTVGHQRQRDSSDVINERWQVTVYYNEGDFEKSSGAAIGSVMHDISFTIQLAVAPAAKVDLSIFKDENSTAKQRETALRNANEAGVIADDEMDELIDIVYQILMDARNTDMGMPRDADHPKRRFVADRWVSQIRKGTPMPDGEYALLTASMRLTCRVEETITGEDLPATPVNGAVFDGDIELDGDTAKKGVKVTTTS